jgi:protoporphyrinogen IX oxidase
MLLLWLKAFHLIFMVAWFGGLFYMGRILVYHAENAGRPEMTDLLKLMARRCQRGIATPAMLGTLAFGLSMLATRPEYLAARWLQLKLGFVIALVLYHVYMGSVRARFARDDVFLSPTECRWRNELPLLALIPVVLLAVLRP